MTNEYETELRCPRCGGAFGDSTVERGIVSTPCRECGYVMQAIYCAPLPLEPQPFWRLCMKWRGSSATLKDAALLRQFIPDFKDLPISQVHQRLGGCSELKLRWLPKRVMRELRDAAEARGFQVEAEPEEEELPSS